MRLYGGRYRITNHWLRWLPVGLSPVFSDNARPFRTASGVAINFGPFAFYAFVGPR